MLERGSKKWHDERAEKMLTEIEGLDKKLENVKRKASGKVIKTSNEFIIREVVDFLMGARDSEGNLLKRQKTRSPLIKSVAHDNIWISVEKNPNGRVFHVRLAYITKEGEQRYLSFMEPDICEATGGVSFVSFLIEDIIAVRFGTIDPDENESIRAVNIETRKGIYLVCDNGFIGFSK